MSNRWDQMNAACLRIFGETVTYSPIPGTEFSLRAIVTAPTQLDEVWPGRYHGLFAEASKFGKPPVQGDQVTIGDEKYIVYDVEADEGNGIRLRLRKM